MRALGPFRGPQDTGLAVYRRKSDTGPPCRNKKESELPAPTRQRMSITFFVITRNAACDSTAELRLPETDFRLFCLYRSTCTFLARLPLKDCATSDFRSTGYGIRENPQCAWLDPLRRMTGARGINHGNHIQLHHPISICVTEEDGRFTICPTRRDAAVHFHGVETRAQT